MYMIAEVSQYVAVASFTEAWIEIVFIVLSSNRNTVASFTEAWIEISIVCVQDGSNDVASFTEAWIEMDISEAYFFYTMSPPSRRRGLK